MHNHSDIGAHELAHSSGFKHQHRFSTVTAPEAGYFIELIFLYLLNRRLGVLQRWSWNLKKKIIYYSCEISGFLHGIVDVCALLSCYAALVGTQKPGRAQTSISYRCLGIKSLFLSQRNRSLVTVILKKKYLKPSSAMCTRSLLGLRP